MMVALTAFFLFSPLLGCEENLRLALVALQQHDSVKANALLDSAATHCSQSSDSRILFTLGSLLGERGDYRKAVDYLSRIPEADVDDAVSFNLGLGYSHLHQFDKARSAYFQTIDHRPGYVEAYFRIGLDYAAGGEPRKAIPWLFRARDLGGNRPEIAYVLIEQLLRLKYTKTAEEVVNATLERSPHDPLLTVAFGDVLQQKGDTIAAISKYQDAINQYPHLPAALIGLAQAAISKGNDGEAQAYLLEALANDPSNSSAKGQLGILEGRRGDCESAAAHLQSAWEADQSNASIGLELARALRHCGQFSHALEILKALEPQMQDSSPFHLELATLYVQLHRAADAQAERTIVANLQSQAHQDLRFQDSQTYVY
ncbi:MAG: tetratricopeptide repeat protein [Acidobacteriaceae bacterium]|nr:tetratricopeptide repeat protein [Acidobacteriaceae bacterium]